MAVQYLFNGPVSAGDVSPALPGRDISQVSIECSAIGKSGAAVSAVVVFEGSNTGNDWVPIAELKPSGTGRGTDGGMATTNWQSMRARVQSVSADTQIICAMTTRSFPYGS